MAQEERREMVQTTERSGDYGAAIRGEYGTPYRRDAVTQNFSEPITGHDTENEGTHKAAITFGVVLIVALILLCFRLALSGNRQEASPRLAPNTTPRQSPLPFAPTVATRMTTAPLVNLPVPTPPAPAPVTRALLLSPDDRDRLLMLLSDCRAALDTATALQAKWRTAASETKAATTVQLSRTDDIAAPSVPQPAPRSLSERDIETIDTQMDAIASSIGLATQPARYPVELGDLSAALGRETRTFLQTERIALTETDAARRGMLQTRADAHRQEATRILSVLETAVRTGTVNVGDMP